MYVHIHIVRIVYNKGYTSKSDDSDKLQKSLQVKCKLGTESTLLMKHIDNPLTIFFFKLQYTRDAKALYIATLV